MPEINDHFQSTEMIDQGAKGGEALRQGCAFFSSYAYWTVD
jgi:hypothetical protein